VLTRTEFDKAVQCVKSGRAAGHDGIPKEGWKYLDKALDDLFLHTSLCWNLETFSEGLILGLVAILYKGKGKNPNVYNSSRPIWLMVFVMKVLDAESSTRARVTHGAAAWGDAPSSSRCGPRRAPGKVRGGEDVRWRACVAVWGAK
jgi:hypothetical protein